MKRVVKFAMMGLLVAQLALGDDFWLKTKYTQWTQDEVQKLMRNSPWAKEVTVALGPPDPAALGVGSIRREGAAEAQAEKANEVSNYMADNRATMVIAWRSALPLKEALLRGLILAGEKTDAAKTLRTRDPNYIIVVSGVPLDIARAAEESQIAHQSVLTIHKKTSIHPISENFEVHGQTMDIFLAFPRTAPIVVKDEEVEVDVKLGPFDAKEKFKLKDMVFHGKLEL